jgi:putative DNA primase/helicase
MMSSKPSRTYSAKERAAKNGAPNPADERTERELRQNLITAHGKPAFYRSKDGELFTITKVNPPFFSGLYASKNSVLWEPEEQRFYDYEASSGLWRVRTEEKLLQGVRQFMLAESKRQEIAHGFPALDLEERLSLKLDNEIVLRLKAEAEVREAFKRKANFSEGRRHIHFANGAFQFHDGKPAGFREGFNKLDFSRNRSPVAYDPKADCPRFVDWLRNAFDPATAEADIDVLFAYIGMCLLGHNVFQKILILQGAANAGKSTFARMIVALIGAENTARLNTEVVNDRFGMTSFVGKTLLHALDVDPKFLLHRGAEKLKSLTGGDPLDADMKFGGTVNFYGIFNALITMNSASRVKLQGDGDAWERRVIVMQFDKPPLRIQRDFEHDLLKSEGSGIVNRAIDALLCCLKAGDMPLTAPQKRRVKDMLDRSDPVQEFVLDRIEKHEGGSLTKRDMREAFKAYCKDRRWSVPSDREIGARLKEVMKEVFGVDESNSVLDHTGSNQIGYRGVAWRTD